MTRILVALLLTLSTPAMAQAFDRVSEESSFIALIDGKALSNRLYGITLNVAPTGTIVGDALGWDIDGNWTWQDGFFCRQMAWGGDPIPYNCQLVEARGDEIRFTSDQGTGDATSFKLR